MDGSLSADEVELCVISGVMDPLLREVTKETGIARRRYLLHALERALRWVDPGMLAEDDAARLRALGLSTPTSPKPPPNAVRIPFVAEGFGFVRTLFVTFRPWSDVVDRALSEGSTATVVRALELAAERTGRGTTEGYALTAAQPDAFAQLAVHGDSLGAAAFVSAVSLWTRRPVRARVVISGGLQGDRVVPVGGLAAKLRAVERLPFERPTFVVPAADARALGRCDRVSVVGVETVEELLSAALEATPTRAPDSDERVHDATRTFRTGWQRWHWAGMRAELERLLSSIPDRRPDLLVQVHAMLAAAARHEGEPEESLAILGRAGAILATGDGRAAVPDAPLSFYHRQRAMTLRQLGAFDAAWYEALAAIAAAEHGRLRGELIPSHGTAGLIASSRGRTGQAVEHHRRALTVALIHAPSSAPRSTSYLVPALAQAGRWDEAEAAFADGLDQIARFSSDGARPHRAAWLRTNYAVALAAAGRCSRALEVLDDAAVRDALTSQPRPGLDARRALGVALAQLGREAEGYALLAASPTAYGQLLGPHNRSLAAQNVLHEARARIERGQLTADARARALHAIDEIPAYDAAAAWLQPLAANAADALASGDAYDAEEARAALGALLDACERLG